MSIAAMQHKEAYDRYLAPKPADDIDLVKQVEDILCQYGLKPQLDAHYHTHRFIVEAGMKHSSVQRHLMNRYWNLQLSMAAGSGEIRPYLIQTSTVENWLELFSRHVAPFIANHELPRPIAL